MVDVVVAAARRPSDCHLVPVHESGEERTSSRVIILHCVEMCECEFEAQKLQRSV